MTVSVVMRTHNEAARLRLALASLEGQPGLDEVVVVDDGSTDGTRAVLREAERKLPLRRLHHARAQGRSAASNAGAAAASGDVLVFLDGDTLAAPGLVQRHRDLHAGQTGLIGRGETWHLRCTRAFSDPEAGTLWPHEPATPPNAAARVTRRQIREDFSAVAARATPGIYPGIDPRRLYETEMAALQAHGASDRLWAAASGSNFSVGRALFQSAGGFDPGIDINEHRELAYRLYRGGARMVAVAARSYHLTHRRGWRDPLAEDGWEQTFRRAHPEAPITELKAFWAALGQGAQPADFFAP